MLGMSESTVTGVDESAHSMTTGLHRKLRVWEVTALSVGFMGPVMAMSLNGIGVAGLVGKAVPFIRAITRSSSSSCSRVAYGVSWRSQQQMNFHHWNCPV